MSDENQKKTLSPFMERFLISILGTTISIALTFGTTALVNAHKKKAAQKQTAMLVIHDINNTIESMEADKNQYEKYYESAQYFLEYMDCPEAADSVRLSEAIDASLQLLTHSERDNSINESTEKIFTGSLDAWNNLDNMRFVENVQNFYYSRRRWLDLTNTSLSWKEPIEEAEVLAQIANFDYSKSYTQWDLWGEFLKGKMKDKSVRYYLDITPNRINKYNNIIQSLSDLNEENMFLMNITDEELERFVNEIEDNKSPLNERDIVGTWVDSQSVSGSYVREDEFRSDHSFEARDTIVYTNWQFRGKIKVNIALGGKWEIKKDSLIRYYDKETIRTAIDTSGVSAGEDRKEALSQYIRSLSGYYEKSMVEELDTLTRTAQKGSFNLTHNKMELTTTVTNEKGEPYEQTNHLKRK
jgi:hypothetical protein